MKSPSFPVPFDAVEKHLPKPWDDKWQRPGLVALAACYFLVSWAINFGLPSAQGIMGAQFWPPFFGIGAFMLLCFIALPRSRALYMITGGFLVTAWASRAIGLGLVVAGVSKAEYAPWSSMVGVVAYSILSLLLWYWWLHAVGPWHQMSYARCVVRKEAKLWGCAPVKRRAVCREMDPDGGQGG